METGERGVFPLAKIAVSPSSSGMCRHGLDTGLSVGDPPRSRAVETNPPKTVVKHSAWQAVPSATHIASTVRCIGLLKGTTKKKPWTS
jgi:hypothetical protein